MWWGRIWCLRGWVLAVVGLPGSGSSPLPPSHLGVLPVHCPVHQPLLSTPRL